MLTEGWTIGSLEFGAGQVRTGFRDAGAGCRRRAFAHCARHQQRAAKDRAGSAAQAVARDHGGFVRALASACRPRPAPRPERPGAPKAGGKTPNLDQFTVNLTENAKKGKIDPCWAAISRSGRSSISSRAAGRTTRSSPAKRASARPPWWKASRCASPMATCRRRLRNVTLRTLDLALLQAGAGIKGEFENRLKGLIEEVKIFAHAHHSLHR